MSTLITPRPHLVIPYQYERNKYKPCTPRSTFNQVRKTRNSISMNDVVSAKRQKQLLLVERSKLIAAIARMEQIPRHKQNDEQNRLVADAVSEDIVALRQVIQEKMDQIEQVKMSDTACSINESQEETKILFLELKRLDEEKVQINKELAEEQKELNSVAEEYSDKNIWAMENELEDLRRAVKSKEHAVDKLEYPEKYNKFVKESMEKKEKEEEEEKKLRKQLREAIKKCKEERRKIAKLEKSLAEEI